MPVHAPPSLLSRLGLRWVSLALAACACAALSGCPDRHSERELLIRAGTLASQGQIDEAREMYESALRRAPDSPHVLIRYLSFLVDQDDLTTAAPVVVALDAADLGEVDRARARTEARRYHDRRRARAEGALDPFPDDRDTWEDAMVELLRIDRGGPLLETWGQYLLRRTRSLLGAPPTTPLDAESIAARTERLAPNAAREALDLCRRNLDGDPRLGFRPVLSAEMEAEAGAVRARLERIVFDLDFDERFATEGARSLEPDVRWERAHDHLRIRWTAAWAHGLHAESSEELRRQQARTWYAREIATDLAYRLAGRERGDADPLPFELHDFDDARAEDLGVADDGSFTFTLLLPYPTLRRGAWLLRLRVGDAPEPVDEAPATP